MSGIPDICDEIVLSETIISKRVDALGEQITRDYRGRDLRLITVLKGGLFFHADLARRIALPLQMDFMAISQYQLGHPGSVRVTKDLDDDIASAHVLLVEDMVDTGLTLNYILRLLQGRSPASLEVCALFDKPARRIAEVSLAYRGFELDDGFYVGYGLDLHGRYRELPFLASVREEVVCP